AATTLGRRTAHTATTTAAAAPTNAMSDQRFVARTAACVPVVRGDSGAAAGGGGAAGAAGRLAGAGGGRRRRAWRLARGRGSGDRCVDGSAVRLCKQRADPFVCTESARKRSGRSWAGLGAQQNRGSDRRSRRRLYPALRERSRLLPLTGVHQYRDASLAKV